MCVLCSWRRHIFYIFYAFCCCCAKANTIKLQFVANEQANRNGKRNCCERERERRERREIKRDRMAEVTATEYEEEWKWRKKRVENNDIEKT